MDDELQPPGKGIVKYWKRWLVRGSRVALDALDPLKQIRHS